MDEEEQLAALVLHYIRRESWMSKAACKGLGADVFVLERGVSSDLAYMTCNGCSVRAECKAYQRRTGSVGIWGGELVSELPSEKEIAEANREVNHTGILMRRTTSRKVRD